MAFDGVFIHYYLKELKDFLVGKRISKVVAITDYEYAFLLSSKQVLILSANKNFSCFYLKDTIKNFSKSSFLNSLKKYFEPSFIKDITQVENDRIVKITVEKNDELGYSKEYSLIFEITGKTSNLIICNDNDLIIDAYHKYFDINSRIIEANVKYLKLESNQINPFTIEDDITEFLDNPFQGVSKLLFQEICYRSSLRSVIYGPIAPTIYLGDKKQFSCFELKSNNSIKKEFSSLNELICCYVENFTNVSSSKDEEIVKNYIKKELDKCKNKIVKQQNELEKAKDYSDLERKANLLIMNIDLVKPYQKSINVYDEEGRIITIPLNQNISPKENINYYFNKIKKQKRAIEEITKQIENTKEEISYYNLLLDQVRIASTSSIIEIEKELGLKKKDIRPTKPAITKYIDEDGNIIYVGKNNTQNDYLTNKLAKPNDYFFHITSYPGCHVIFEGNLTPNAIKIASEICAYHSKMTSTVSIDYTMIKYVKKIKGYVGSFVRYTNQKTTYASGDYEYIQKHARTVN